MILREIKKEDKDAIMNMYIEYINAEPIEGIDTFEGIRNFEHLSEMTFEEWFEELENNKDETKLPEYFSTQTTYIVINDNNEIVGALNARWKPVQKLMEFGGLIGYSIRPNARGKGYANEMLKIGLEKFRDNNIKDILISCKDFNIASKKTIEKNGGIFEREYFNEEEGYNYLIYWIRIN